MSVFTRATSPKSNSATAGERAAAQDTSDIAMPLPDATFSGPELAEAELVELELAAPDLDSNAAIEVDALPDLPYDLPAVSSAAPVKHAVAFEEIVERYHGKVFQLVYRYLGDYDEACDLTQDTFVRAYSAWNEFRGESQIYTWLYRIAINLCHNQQKKLQRRRRVERLSLDTTPGDAEQGPTNTQWNSREVADERPLPLQILESHELRLRLQEALRELPENYRTVILLRDMEGLSYEEIARITDSTLEAIKSRLFRARGAIRRLMEPYLLAETAHATQAASTPAATEKRRRFRLL